MQRGTDWGDPDQPVEGGDVPEGAEQDRPQRPRERPQGRGERGPDPADDDTQPIPKPSGVHRE